MLLVKTKKCYHCKVIEDLTNTKLVTLQQKYDNLQHYLQTKEDLGVAYRALGYISKVGVTVNMPKLKLRTFASIDRNAMMTKEAIYFNRW
jgi:hypothetical protein